MEAAGQLVCNKEIHLLRLAVTTRCTLRCRYCFVRRGNSVISYSDARKAVELILESPGRQKIMIIYGGEPLLFSGLVKKIIDFSIKRADVKNKSLVISVGTNATVLDKDLIGYFKASKIKLAVSLDGKRRFNDYARVWPGGKGSFNAVIDKIALIKDSIAPEDVCVLCSVLPGYAAQMHDNLVYLTELGFENINIEPVQSEKFFWTEMQKKVFFENLLKFGKSIIEGIRDRKFVFLNSVNRELADKRLSGNRNICPFYENLEIYPAGEMAFSPFLINSPARSRYIIGNLNTGFLEKYRLCGFDPVNLHCGICRHDYQAVGVTLFKSSFDVVKKRNEFSIGLARLITVLSRNKNNFLEYARRAKKRIFE